MSHTKTLSVIVLMVLALSPGCQKKETSTKQASIVIPTENDVQTLDPAVLSDPYTSRIVWQIYEGLVGLDAAGNPLPLLASSWEASGDNKVWTFMIRTGVKFHKSGVFKSADSTRTVNAYDVLYTYNRFAKGFGSFVFSGLVMGFDDYIAGKETSVAGFVAIDSSRFRVVLTRPEPTFVFRLTSPYLAIHPREAVETDPNAFGKTICVGTGLYQFVKRTETEVVLAKNDLYWRSTSGNVSTITFRVEKNAQFRVAQLQNGVYHLLQLPMSFVPQFMSGDSLKRDLLGKFVLYSKTSYNVHYMGINCQSVTDIRLRRAISFAIDKGSFVNSLLYGQAKPASSPILPGMQGYLPPPGLNYDPDSARAELKRSGYRSRALTLLVSDAPNSEQIGQVVQGNLKSVGINVTLQKLDFNTLISRVFSKERPDLFVLFSEWIYSAPEFIIDSYNSSKFPNPNLFGYSNKEVDRIITQIPQTTRREEINSLCYRAEALALTEAPSVWLFHLRNVYIANRHLNGFSVNAHNHWDFTNLTWTE